MTQLKKEITLIQGLAMFVMTLMGTGIFVIPAIAASKMGAAATWAWIIMSLLIIPVAITFARLGRKYPDAGGTAYFIRQAFGRRLEGVAGWLFLASFPVGAPAALTIAAGYLSSLFGQGSEWIALVEIFIIVLLLAIGLMETKASGYVQLAIAVVVILVIIGLWSGASPPINQSLSKGIDQWQNDLLMPTLAIMFWSFLGIEAISHLGGEFKNPNRDFPIIVIAGVIIVGIFYAMASLLILSQGSYGNEAENTQSFSLLASTLFGDWGRRIMALVGFLACFAAINTYFISFTRMLWKMATENSVPAPFKKVSKRGVPYVSVIFLCAVVMLATLGRRALDFSLDQMILYSNGVFITVYLLTMLAGMRLLQGSARLLAGLSFIFCLLIQFNIGMELSYALSVVALAWLFEGYKPIASDPSTSVPKLEA